MSKPMRPAVLIIALAVAAASHASMPAAAAPKAAISAKPAAATDISAQRRARRVTRIEVTPARRLYRQCVDWYALERRPSGPVITPHMRCQWALR